MVFVYKISQVILDTNYDYEISQVILDISTIVHNDADLYAFELLEYI